MKLHARENYNMVLTDVQESESKMGIQVRWLVESQEWADAAHLVSTKRYRLALMKLEKLVVQRMFKLTKMNLSQTGIFFVLIANSSSKLPLRLQTSQAYCESSAGPLPGYSNGAQKLQYRRCCHGTAWEEAHLVGGRGVCVPLGL
jgi:hypothetical protein